MSAQGFECLIACNSKINQKHCADDTCILSYMHHSMTNFYVLLIDRSKKKEISEKIFHFEKERVYFMNCQENEKQPTLYCDKWQIL